MDEEQFSEAKLTNPQSPRQASLKSATDVEPPIISADIPVEKQATPVLSSTINTPKVQSPIDSILHTSNPMAPTPVKGSVQMSFKSENSNKKTSLKSLEDVATASELNNKESEIKKSYEDPAKNLEKSQDTPVYSNIDKISNMSKILTNEANALRDSIKSLSQNIVRTKEELQYEKEDVNFPYHLFLIEIIINKINMKCECFELDDNNLVIAATFLGKQPITLYDSSYGKIDDFFNLNVGKSVLFAMTYDKICSIKEFIMILHLTKQPPCSKCVTKIAETKIDYTKEFVNLREELCKKWAKEQPNDNIMCTTSTPLNRNMYYLSCGDSCHSDTIGIIELTTRMSFLGKEISTAFCASSKPKCTSVLMKENNGISMYSCQNVEMDDEGKILLDENTLTRKDIPRSNHTMSTRGCESPLSQFSNRQGSNRQYISRNDYIHKYQKGILGY